MNFPRLKRFIARELQYREDQGQLAADQITVEDVVNETIASALGEPMNVRRSSAWNHGSSPCDEAIDRLARRSGEGICRWSVAGHPNVQASDEDFCSSISRSDRRHEALPPMARFQPEDLAAKDEMITLVERTLRDAGRMNAKPSSCTRLKVSPSTKSRTSPRERRRRCEKTCIPHANT